MDDGGRRDDDYRSNRAESTASPLPFSFVPPLSTRENASLPRNFTRPRFVPARTTRGATTLSLHSANRGACTPSDVTRTPPHGN